MYLRENASDLNEYEKAELLSYLPNFKGKKVLELAAGIGRFTRYFASQADHFTAVDIAPQFIEKNREDHVDCKNVSFICSDAMDLSFLDQSFDFIFCNWLFMFLEDDEVERLMGRIYRWLNPQGALFFRESCDFLRSKSSKERYFAHYRAIFEYDTLVKKSGFTLLKEGHIQAYIFAFGDPFQCYWSCRK